MGTYLGFRVQGLRLRLCEFVFAKINRQVV